MEKYEVLRLVGEGSFGRVFQAKQRLDAKTVALKVISKVSITKTNCFIINIICFSIEGSISKRVKRSSKGM